MARGHRISQYTREHVERIVKAYGEKNAAKSLNVPVSQLRNWQKGTGMTRPSDLRKIHQYFKEGSEKNRQMRNLQRLKSTQGRNVEIERMKRIQEPLPGIRRPGAKEVTGSDFDELTAITQRLAVNPNDKAARKEIVQWYIRHGIDPHSPQSYIRRSIA